MRLVAVAQVSSDNHVPFFCVCLPLSPCPHSLLLLLLLFFFLLFVQLYADLILHFVAFVCHGMRLLLPLLLHNALSLGLLSLSLSEM